MQRTLDTLSKGSLTGLTATLGHFILYESNPRFLNLPIICLDSVTIELFRLLLNPLNAELNPICTLLALFEAHHILHVSR